LVVMLVIVGVATGLSVVWVLWNAYYPPACGIFAMTAAPPLLKSTHPSSLRQPLALRMERLLQTREPA